MSMYGPDTLVRSVYKDAGGILGVVKFHSRHKFIGISHNGIAADFESAVFLDIEGSNPSIPSTHAGGQHGVEAAFQAVAKA